VAAEVAEDAEPPDPTRAGASAPPSEMLNEECCAPGCGAVAPVTETEEMKVWRRISPAVARLAGFGAKQTSRSDRGSAVR
jgi:hypothetical protein